MLWVLEGEFLDSEGALLHSLPKGGGPWPLWPPDSYVPASVNNELLRRSTRGKGESYLTCQESVEKYHTEHHFIAHIYPQALSVDIQIDSDSICTWI